MQNRFITRTLEGAHSDKKAKSKSGKLLSLGEKLRNSKNSVLNRITLKRDLLAKITSTKKDKIGAEALRQSTSDFRKPIS